MGLTVGVGCCLGDAEGLRKRTQRQIIGSKARTCSAAAANTWVGGAGSEVRGRRCEDEAPVMVPIMAKAYQLPGPSLAAFTRFGNPVVAILVPSLSKSHTGRLCGTNQKCRCLGLPISVMSQRNTNAHFDAVLPETVIVGPPFTTATASDGLHHGDDLLRRPTERLRSGVELATLTPLRQPLKAPAPQFNSRRNVKPSTYESECA